MLHQAGRLLFISEDRNVVHVGKLSKFSYSRKGTKLQAQGFPIDPGPIQVLDSEVTKEEWALKISQESFDELDLQFVLDQQESTIATIQLPGETTKVTVPATAPYTVTVTGLIANQDVKATVVSDTDPRYLTQVNSAPDAAKEFQITANTVTFNSTEAGETVALYYLETKEDIEIIGADAAPATYGVCAFKGIIKGTRTQKHVWFPRVRYTRDFEQGFGDKSEVSMEFDILTPSAWNVPYAFWDYAA
ncbi:MAG TPA: hypothetical protein V6C64_15235 [Microcoleaceae cyanobacterium]|jgi:hypothetical protein